MKYILSLILVLCFVVSKSQVLQEPNIYGYKFKRSGSDTLHFIPSDTLRIPTQYNGLSFIANKGGKLYYWNGVKWILFSEGSSYTFTNGITESGGVVSWDSTNVYNEIGAKADSLRRSGLTVQMRKGGVWTNQFDLPDSGSTIYTASNGITLSGSDFKLGGTLTENTIIKGSNLKTFGFDSLWSFSASAIQGNVLNTLKVGYVYNSFLEAVDLTSPNRRSSVNIQLDGASLLSYNSSNVNTSSMSVSYTDSAARIYSRSGKIILLGLTNSPGTKSLRYNPSTGLVSYADTTTSGITSINSQTGASQTIAGDGFVSVASSSNTHTLTFTDHTTLATFSAGARFQADTALFTDSTIYGSYFNSTNDTVIIEQIVAVMNGGTSDTLGVQIYYNDTLNVVGSAVATSTLAVNSTTTGNSTTTLTNYKVPPSNWIWCKTPVVVAGRKPYYLSVSIIGYRKKNPM